MKIIKKLFLFGETDTNSQNQIKAATRILFIFCVSMWNSKTEWKKKGKRNNNDVNKTYI